MIEIELKEKCNGGVSFGDEFVDSVRLTTKNYGVLVK